MLNANQYKNLFNKLEEIEKMLIRLNIPTDRIGGVGLASEVTGYKSNTIYAKVNTNDIPFKKMGRRLIFSESQLRDWMIGKTSITETVSHNPHAIKRGRKPRVSGLILDNTTNNN